MQILQDQTYAHVRGFNYQPSWGSTGFEIWRQFDADRMGHELALGKHYFPGITHIRLWLSHDAWLREPTAFAARFEQALALAETFRLQVMPVLFNRWHETELDYGGIYIDHFLPKVSWVQNQDKPAAFAKAIVGPHAEDPRIFAWDLCNEPFSYSCPREEIPEIVAAERAWLGQLYQIVKTCGATAPVTVGMHAALELVEEISDFFSIHPYWTSGGHQKADYEATLDFQVNFANKAGKPLLSSETCWGAVDDAERVEIVAYTLEQHARRGIGWLAYLLHHSLIADAHRAEYGPMGVPGNLSFIDANGSLRPGHEIFNNY